MKTLWTFFEACIGIDAMDDAISCNDQHTPYAFLAPPPAAEGILPRRPPRQSSRAADAPSVPPPTAQAR
jgi:hypothetical protein